MRLPGFEMGGRLERLRCARISRKLFPPTTTVVKLPAPMRSEETGDVEEPVSVETENPAIYHVVCCESCNLEA